MATVKVNEAAIRSALSGGIVGTGPRGRGGNATTQRARVLANLITAQAVKNASGEIVQERTGDLKRSMRPIVRETPRGVEVGVGSTIEYSQYLEEGTDPHEITIRRGRVVRTVQHPGNRPFQILENAKKTVLASWRG